MIHKLRELQERLSSLYGTTEQVSLLQSQPAQTHGIILDLHTTDLP